METLQKPKPFWSHQMLIDGYKPNKNNFRSMYLICHIFNQNVENAGWRLTSSTCL
jgi:hypothetical protein